MKLAEIKAKSSERLIADLVDIAVTVAHNGGRMSQQLVKTEQRIVSELSARFGLDEGKLNELLNK